MTRYPLTIYIDLDHTLLNTDAYKETLFRALQPFGITRAKCQASYQTARKSGFAVDSFLCKLFRAGTPPGARAALLRVARTSGAFLYPDARPFLQTLRKRNVRLILYSWGNRAFQRLKIKSIPRFTPLFERIMITTNYKKQLKLPQRPGQCLMIDDRPEVLAYYARKFGVQPILLQRQGRLPPGAFRSLRAVVQMLSKQGFLTS